MAQVRPERTGRRDANLSLWHRKILGYDCPATDLDFVLVEYDRGMPRAIIEHKYELTGAERRDHPTYRALKFLCDRAEIAFILCNYFDNMVRFRVEPLNDIAAKLIPPDGVIISAVEYASLLYKGLRHREIPDDVRDAINRWASMSTDQKMSQLRQWAEEDHERHITESVADTVSSAEQSAARNRVVVAG